MVEYKYDLHSHTLVSGHAYSTMTEMIQSAADKHLEALGITDHAPALPGTCHEIYFRNFKVIPRTRFGVRIFMGAELNIMNERGEVDLPTEVLKRLDYTIASLHTQCMPPGSKSENTNACIQALKNPYVQILGHPDDGRYELDYLAVVQAAKESHKLIELNNSSLRTGGARIHSWEIDRTLLPLCARYKVPIVVNSDSHIDLDVGCHDLAYSLLEELNFPDELIINQDLNLFLPYLKEKES